MCLSSLRSSTPLSLISTVELHHSAHLSYFNLYSNIYPIYPVPPVTPPSLFSQVFSSFSAHLLVALSISELLKNDHLNLTPISIHISFPQPSPTHTSFAPLPLWQTPVLPWSLDLRFWGFWLDDTLRCTLGRQDGHTCQFGILYVCLHTYWYVSILAEGLHWQALLVYIYTRNLQHCRIRGRHWLLQFACM